MSGHMKVCLPRTKVATVLRPTGRGRRGNEKMEKVRKNQTISLRHRCLVSIVHHRIWFGSLKFCSSVVYRYSQGIVLLQSLAGFLLSVWVAPPMGQTRICKNGIR